MKNREVQKFFTMIQTLAYMASFHLDESGFAKIRQANNKSYNRTLKEFKHAVKKLKAKR